LHVLPALLAGRNRARHAVMPSAVVAALVAAGLGERNLHGTLDLNDAGRRYIAKNNLSTNKIEKHRKIEKHQQ
jgi:hypothetical protein